MNMSGQTHYSTIHLHCDVLLVTVAPVETQAVLSACQHVTHRAASPLVLRQKTYYDLHQIAGIRVFLVESEMGSRGPDGSTLTVLAGIKALEPGAIIMVGIAFGLRPDRQQIGDILISSHLRDYEGMRLGTAPDGSMHMLARGERPRASSWLLDRCRAARLTWTSSAVHIGLLLSGEKLVDHPAFLAQLSALEPEAIGGEMEAAGLYAAAHRERVDWIVVKGISDWADGSKGEQKEMRQSLAATNAAQFVITVLQQGVSESKKISGERSQLDWGEAPQPRQLYGRDRELAQLKRWMLEDHCSQVAILGMGGMGKTSLAAALVDQIHKHYDSVFWRSLHNAPPLKGLLQECIQFVSDQQHSTLPAEIDRRITLLIEYFRVHRCLLVLDNVESILQGGSQASQYREGCEGYGRLLQRIGESKHQSCLLLTSREKPPEVAFLEGEAVTTRSLHLGGLKPAAGRDILKDKGLQGAEHDWEVLVAHYEGNPLVLKLVAQVIREVFGGTITAFLKDGELFFRDVRDVLEQQMKRLSALEEEIVSWLAIEREAITLSDLQENIVHSVPKGELQEALRSLQRRQLIETSATGSTLHHVIMEYLTERFVDRVCEEIKTGTLVLFERHALLKAQAKDYIRESQHRLILLPLAHCLLTLFGKEALKQRFKSLLVMLRAQHDQRPSYAAGNVLNLLIQLRCDLSNYDFSHLTVCQAYLQSVALPSVNFAHANLARSVFTETFGIILPVVFSSNGKMLAAGTAIGEIRMWRIPDGTPLLTYQAHSSWVWSLAFSPDGNVLASGSGDRTVRLWEVRSSRCLRTLQGHTNIVRSVAFSPDGTTLASGSEDRTVRLWEASSGRCLRTLQGHTDIVRSVAFSPDGTTLASGSEDHSVRLWEVNSGQCLTSLQGYSNEVWSVAFSPDGSMLASGSDDQTVRLWEVNSGRCLRILQGHTNRVGSVAFSPDGSTLASGSEDQTVRLWEASSGRYLRTLQEDSKQLSSIAFSPDGNMLASSGRSIQLLEVSTGRCLHTLPEHTHRVRSVAFSPDGSALASGSEDGTIKIWNTRKGKCLKTLTSDRPYERMNIAGVKGLTEAQKIALRALGAIEDEGKELALKAT